MGPNVSDTALKTSLIALIVVVVIQVRMTPTVYHCLVTEGWMFKFTGKTHCELQGWRHLLRGNP